MADEKTEKREIEIVANPDHVDNYPSDSRLVTSVGFRRGTDVKYEIYFMVPKTDEEAKERYDCDLAYLLTQGVRSISTRPNYQAVGFDKDGNLVPDGHNKMQAAADEYKIGRKGTGVTVKAKARQMDEIAALAEGADMSMDELKDLLKKAKEGKAQ